MSKGSLKCWMVDFYLAEFQLKDVIGPSIAVFSVENRYPLKKVKPRCRGFSFYQLI